MKKLIIGLALFALPALAFARGGGPVGGGGFHGSSSFGGSRSFSSGSSYHSYSTPPSSVHIYNGGGSYYSGGTTHVYSGTGGSDFWFYMWLIDHNNNQSYKNHVVDSQEHFPYVIVLDKTAKDYMLVRYIGEDNKTEKVSPQEAAGLTWLKGEINY